nr:hypothetical protein [Tanacetum cinerariifolium]
MNINAQFTKPSVDYFDNEDDDDDNDDDDDDDTMVTIILPPAIPLPLPLLTTMKPIDTLLMGDEDSSTTLARETDQFIESGADDLVPIPMESEKTSDDDSEYNMLHISLPTIDQKFNESFHEAWERYKDLLHACPHHGFTELHQLDTFYNALNPADQDSLNAAAGGNLLEKSPQDVLTIIENKSKVHNSRSKPIAFPVNACDINSSSEIAKLTHAVNQQSAVTTAMTAMLKQLQANPPPAQVKAIKEICVTCRGAHPYYRCLAAGGNTFPEFRDNIQGYVSAAAGNYNQGFNRGPNFNQEQPYQATSQSNQNFYLNELKKIKRMNDVSLKAMQNQIDMVKNELRNEMKTSIQTSLSNQTNEIKNMMASLLLMNTASTSGSRSLPGNTVANPKGELKAITTRSRLVTDGPTVPTPPKSVTPEEDECVEETYMDPDLAEYTIKVPPPPV